MDNPVSYIIILTLIAVIVIQALERYFFAEQSNKDRSKLIAALLAKDTQEYTQILTADKQVEKPVVEESDEVNLAEADDETFDKFIANQ